MILFAALSYGWTQLGWLPGKGSIIVAIVSGLGLVAAVLLGVAFYFGVKLLGVGEISQVGTQALADALRTGTIDLHRLPGLLSSFGENIGQAINEDLVRAQAIIRPVKWLNRFTMLGFIFVAAFTMIAVAGSHFSKVSSSRGSNMMINEEESKPKPEQESPSQKEGPAEAGSQPRQEPVPRLVEPTVTVPLSERGQRRNA